MQLNPYLNELSQKGTVQIPIQETFWALRFGMFVNRFGIPWMVKLRLASEILNQDSLVVYLTFASSLELPKAAKPGSSDCFPATRL
jgi:hypothetical protein